MGMVDIQDIEFLSPEIIREVSKILRILKKPRDRVGLQCMIQMKLWSGLDAGLDHPFLKAIFHRMRRPSVCERHLVAPSLKFLAQTDRRIGRSGPFPIAEEMKDLQRWGSCPSAGRGKRRPFLFRVRASVLRAPRSTFFPNSIVGHL